jgi:hypothetical protein
MKMLLFYDTNSTELFYLSMNWHDIALRVVGERKV